MAVGNSRIPIIFITAYEADNRRIQALEAGAAAFLYKPFQEGELLNAIDAALKDS
jgi:DNA-binding response OmpR family regulator